MALIARSKTGPRTGLYIVDHCHVVGDGVVREVRPNERVSMAPRRAPADLQVCQRDGVRLTDISMPITL